MTDNAALLPHDFSRLISAQLKQLVEQASLNSDALSARLVSQNLAKAFVDSAGERLATSVSESLLKSFAAHQSLVGTLTNDISKRVSQVGPNDAPFLDNPFSSALRAHQNIADDLASTLSKLDLTRPFGDLDKRATAALGQFEAALHRHDALRDEIAKALRNTVAYSDLAGKVAAAMSVERGFSNGSRAEAWVAQAAEAGFREAASAVDGDADDITAQYARGASQELVSIEGGGGRASDFQALLNLLSVFAFFLALWDHFSNQRQLDSLAEDHERLAAYDEMARATQDSVMELLTAIASAPRWSAKASRPSIVRSRPARNSGAIGRLPVGTQVDVMARKKEWAKVRYAQSDSLRTGWVENKLLTATESE